MVDIKNRPNVRASLADIDTLLMADDSGGIVQHLGGRAGYKGQKSKGPCPGCGTGKVEGAGYKKYKW
jgi:hypothetical protein